MKAITVQQPWAWAIIHGGKDVENRTQLWTYRGPVAIHAGSRWSDRGGDSDEVAEAWARERRIKPEFGNKCYPLPHETYFPTGTILGVVDLVDAHHAHVDCCKSEWAEQSYVEHGGRQRGDLVHLDLENPRSFELRAQPIKVKGALGLWTPDSDVLHEINHTLELLARIARDASTPLAPAPSIEDRGGLWK